MVRIERTTATAVIGDPAFPALRDEYARECALLGLPDPKEKLAIYQMLDGSDHYHALAAREEGELVGFAAILSPELPHYGRTIATMESLFVASAHRHSGAGLQLIYAAEKLARELGSPALLVSSPADGRLARILPALKYRQTNVVYMKEFTHE